MSELTKQLDFIKNTFIEQENEKERSSFLFSKEERSKMKISELYQIGLEGLKELIHIDSRFIEFETSLFNESSINFNRELQTQEINEELNESINRIFQLI